MLHTARSRVATAGAVLLVAIVAFVASSGSRSTATLVLPPAGQVAAGAVGDVPVFVTHATDGTVYVLDARSPHDVFPKVLAWCRPAAVFEDLWHGSIFDAAGRWIGGPAPTDMTTYPILQRTSTQVRVGQPASAPARSVEASDVQEPAGIRCDARTALYGPGHPADPDVLDDLVVHDDLDRFTDVLWFPTPARVVGDAPRAPDT